MFFSPSPPCSQIHTTNLPLKHPTIRIPPPQIVTNFFESSYISSVTSWPPYELPPNRLSRDMYDHLPLPWNIPHPIPSSILPESQFLKLDYDRDGILSDPSSNDFFGGGREVTLMQAEKGLSTASMVTRWREAHPKEAGTEKDIVKLHIEEVRKLMGGRESMMTGSGTTIIFVKKALEHS
ncbi:hypothetical protein EYC84_006569 [Monilinia fructicola]|uniref:Uncharacterized protein n=1 Tax=Monilinia fructicola TaxID=38448 RepID=A0A5M9K7K3_MONFR|nr:hypothetical protein EYC84_006569 [Monilinia fructicola]